MYMLYLMLQNVTHGELTTNDNTMSASYVKIVVKNIQTHN